MNEPETPSQGTAAPMLKALARWEQDGGAHGNAMQTRPPAGQPPLAEDAVWAEIALQQGMRLERCDRGGANYRLVVQGAVPPQHEVAGFKLTLDDVETILMNSNPA